MVYYYNRGLPSNPEVLGNPCDTEKSKQIQVL